MKYCHTYLHWILLISLLLFSCTDEIIKENETRYNLNLTLALPDETKAEGRAVTSDPSVDPETPEQKVVDKNDFFILHFDIAPDGSSTLYDVVQPTLFEESSLGIRIEGVMKPSENKAKVVILANINKQNAKSEVFTRDSFLKQFLNKSEADIYKSLIYAFPDPANGNVWKLGDRRLPMWGTTIEFPLSPGHNSSRVRLYRSVAKMGVEVAPECTDFALKEIYVYNVNKQGYIAPPFERSDNSELIQFERPDIPLNTEKFQTPLVYKWDKDDGQYIVKDKKFLNQIYVSEVDNTPLSADKPVVNPLTLVVGGVRHTESGLVDNGAIQYYRIEMKDDLDKSGEIRPYDIIRNHSYLFTITKVSSPGTPTPDEALKNATAGLTVEVTKWAEHFMRGVPDQYTLKTDKSLVKFNAYDDMETRKVEVWTDYGEWHLEQKELKDFEIKQVGSQVHITPTMKNKHIRKVYGFYVVAGSLRKEIMVILPGPETANSYIVGEGEHELNVKIKGNGIKGVLSDEMSLVPPNISVDQFLTLPTTQVAVLWETCQGLIQLKDGSGKLYPNSGNTPTYVPLSEDESSIRYQVTLGDAKIGGVQGGNALIGAFNKEKKLLWSWHIWVCPELDRLDDINNTDFSTFIDKWTINDYDMMDRNLGALTNRPLLNSHNLGDPSDLSVASMGLLYQWGRKDPFIGPAHSNDNFTDDGRINVYHYYEDWGVKQNNEMKEAAFNYCIEHPTQLIFGVKAITNGDTVGTEQPIGLSSLKIKNSKGQEVALGGYLWGTNGGLSLDEKNLGSKTIYDPSPIGFRVPPVDAFAFAKTSKEALEWTCDTSTYENVFVAAFDSTKSKTYSYPNKDTRGTCVHETYPNYFYYQMFKKNDYKEPISGHAKPILVKTGKFIRKSNNRPCRIYKAIAAIKQYPNDIIVRNSETQNWNDNLVYIPYFVDDYVYSNDQFLFKGPYQVNAAYYGFYMDYQKFVKPLVEGVTSYQYGDKSAKDILRYNTLIYALDAKNSKTITWFPLTGAYDPTKGVTFKDNTTQQTIAIEQGSSITVNSFLWTNSSVLKKDGHQSPAAMFLHGAEDIENNGQKASRGDGRHIHNLSDINIQAQPHYAGAIRCIRDRKKNIWRQNSLTEKVDISGQKNSSTSINLVSVNASWKLVDPGAPWIRVTPDAGGPNNLKGETVILTMLKDMTNKVGEQTTLVFQIASESKPRKVLVTIVK